MDLRPNPPLVEEPPAAFPSTSSSGSDSEPNSVRVITGSVVSVPLPVVAATSSSSRFESSVSSSEEDRAFSEQHVSSIISSDGHAVASDSLAPLEGNFGLSKLVEATREDSRTDESEFQPLDMSAESVDELRCAVTKGQADLYFELARQHLSGSKSTIRQSRSQATRYFGLAAAMGHAIAQFEFALCLHRGLGVERDQHESVKWLMKAAEADHPPAVLSLGEFQFVKTWFEHQNFTVSSIK